MDDGYTRRGSKLLSIGWTILVFFNFSYYEIIRLVTVVTHSVTSLSPDLAENSYNLDIVASAQVASYMVHTRAVTPLIFSSCLFRIQSDPPINSLQTMETTVC